MIDTSQWRARIGHWNHRCSSCSRVSNNSTSTDSPIAAANGSILVRSLAIILVIVLMLSGDIELNPGPIIRNPRYMIVIKGILMTMMTFCILIGTLFFRMLAEQQGKIAPELDDVVDHLECHSSQWERIGRKLKVDKDFRDGLHQELKSNDSKLEDVLYNWIQSQCSEVSWDHLMDVLRGEPLSLVTTANKIKDYLLNDPKAKEKYRWIDASVVSATDTVPDAVLNGVDGVMYNDNCGWRLCNYIQLCYWRRGIGKPPKREQNNSTEGTSSACHEKPPKRRKISKESPSELPALRDIRCIRDDYVDECWNYVGISSCSVMDKPKPLHELIGSHYDTKNTAKCQELASSLIDGDICMGRIKGYTNDDEVDYWMRSFLYFLQHSGVDTWNTIHLYQPDKLLKAAVNEPTIHCKKVRISCINVSPLDESEVVLKCIDLFSEDKLQEFNCRFVSSPKFYSVLIKLLKLPKIKRIILKGSVEYDKANAKQWEKDDEQLKEAIAGTSSLEELSLDINGPSSLGHNIDGHIEHPERKTTNAILNGVAMNTSITSLVMKNFHYCEAGPALEQLLKDNKQLKKLWLLGFPSCQSPPNITKINTPLEDLNIFLPNKDLFLILSEIDPPKSLAIGDKWGRLASDDSDESAEISSVSLLKSCPKRLTTSCDKVLQEIMMQQNDSKDVDQVLLPEELVVHEISYPVSTWCRSLKHLEVTRNKWPFTLPHSPDSEINNYSRIISDHTNIEVLKIPVSCCEVGKLVEDMKEKLKNLQTLELRISLDAVLPGIPAATYASTGYDVTAGMFSVVNTILHESAFPKLKELRITNESLQTNSKEADIKGDCVLDKFTSTVISHPSIEYIGIRLNQVYDQHSWISDIYGTILSRWPRKGTRQAPVIEIHPFRGRYVIHF